MVSINFLSKINNNFPIIYGGKDPTIAAKLIILKTNILKKYPKINTWFVFEEEVRKLFDQFPLAISFEKYKEYENNFTKIHKIESDPKCDPVVKFCESNEIDMFVCNAKKINNPKVALISAGLSINTINEAEKKFSSNWVLNPDLSTSIEAFDVVVGKESVDIIVCAAKGKKICLAESKLGFNSFQKMFPDSELFECWINR